MSARQMAIEKRLAEIMPLFQEARDALPAISITSAKLHGVDLSLANRMDAVGAKDWRAALQAELAQVVEPVALITELRNAAKEISAAGHAGWGNTCTSAADALSVYAAQEPAPPEPVNAELLAELQNIASANTRDWDDPSDFKAWAQSRARAAITKAGEA